MISLTGGQAELTCIHVAGCIPRWFKLTNTVTHLSTITFGSLISLVHLSLSAPLCPQAPTLNLLSTCLMVCSELSLLLMFHSRLKNSLFQVFSSLVPSSHGLITW